MTIRFASMPAASPVQPPVPRPFNPEQSGVFLVPPSAKGLMKGGRILAPDETLYLYDSSDTQVEKLRFRRWVHTHLLGRFTSSANRNPILTLTGPVLQEELLRRRKEKDEAHEKALGKRFHVAGIGLGDWAETPLWDEFFVNLDIFRRLEIPIEIALSGNHSAGNYQGLFDMSHPAYRFLSGVKTFPLTLFRFSVNDHPEEAILSKGDAMKASHRAANCHREDMPKPKRLTVAVREADYEGYRLWTENGPSQRVAFAPENRRLVFETFWKPSKGTEMGLTRESRHWECVINYHIADKDHADRGTKVNPIHLQASELCRYQDEDGADAPVFGIGLDGSDHKNLIAGIGGGISELQVRLIETFMDQMLAEHPNARFKIYSHFSAKDLAKVPAALPWRLRGGKKAREAFRRLLARKQVFSFVFGHTHVRHEADLTKTLKLHKLGRKKKLAEVNVPSSIDHRPNRPGPGKETRDGRGLLVEKIHVVEDDRGRRIVNDFEYSGLDEDDLREERAQKGVNEALKDFRNNHGYLRAPETIRDLRYQFLIGRTRGHLKRLKEFIDRGLLRFPDDPKECLEYWKKLSIPQYVIDNFEVVATVNQFNDAYHLIAFMESVEKLIGPEEEPGQLAIRAQIRSLRLALKDEAYDREHEFEQALAKGERPSELSQFNDLFERARTYLLQDQLLHLRPKSPARTFVLLAHMEAAKEEFQKRFFLFKPRPTNVPDRLPSVEIPFEDDPVPSLRTGTG